MSTTYDLIRAAIEYKLQVRAYYHGRPRQMCPHILGYSGGRAQALFYQFAGESERGLGEAGSADNWRCIAIDGLTDVVAVAGPWYTASPPPVGRTQHCVDEVEAAVQL